MSVVDDTHQTHDRCSYFCVCYMCVCVNERDSREECEGMIHQYQDSNLRNCRPQTSHRPIKTLHHLTTVSLHPTSHLHFQKGSIICFLLFLHLGRLFFLCTLAEIWWRLLLACLIRDIAIFLCILQNHQRWYINHHIH